MVLLPSATGLRVRPVNTARWSSPNPSRVHHKLQQGRRVTQATVKITKMTLRMTSSHTRHPTRKMLRLSRTTMPVAFLPQIKLQKLHHRPIWGHMLHTRRALARMAGTSRTLAPTSQRTRSRVLLSSNSHMGLHLANGRLS